MYRRYKYFYLNTRLHAIKQFAIEEPYKYIQSVRFYDSRYMQYNCPRRYRTGGLVVSSLVSKKKSDTLASQKMIEIAKGQK